MMVDRWLKGSNNKINIETIVKTITYLIGAIGFIAVFSHVNVFFSSAFLLLLFLSLYFEFNRKFYLPRWALNILSLSIIALFLFRLNVGDIVTQIIEAFLMLFAIKFLEDKKFRDYMQIYAIILFLLAGTGLLSLDIVFSVYLIILVILLTVSIVLLTFYSQDPNLELSRGTVKKIVLKSMYIPLLAIPLTIVMFVILPRTNYPILNFLNRADKAKTGFTDNVRLGGISGIQEDSSVILRVNMAKIDDNALYWRGVVLDNFDGVAWKSSPKHDFPLTRTVDVKGNKIAQTIYLEPYENIYLFALDKPIFLSSKRIKRNTDLTYSSAGLIEKRIRYEAVSIISDTIGDKTTDEERYLRVPDKIYNRISGLMRSLDLGRSKEDDIRSILGFLNSGSYKYSLENLPVSGNPLEDFLFNVKHGNCEYFASAYAVMLRIAGIPSRLVGGYKGGYYNDMGGYYLVPQKNAHVWVEAYIKNKGWLRIDPTPAGMGTFSSPLKQKLLFKLGLFFDTINYYWFAFVINYNFEKQINILNSFRAALKKPSLTLKFNKRNMMKYGIAISLMLALLLSGYYIAAGGIRKKTAEKGLLLSFLAKMERLGYKKIKTQGLEEFALSIADDNIRRYSLEFVIEFEKLYYRDQVFTISHIKKLKYMIKCIKI